MPRRSTSRALQSQLEIADAEQALDGTEKSCERELLQVESIHDRHRQVHLEAAQQIEEAKALRDELRAADEALQERSEAEASERAELERLTEQANEELQEAEAARAELERRVEEDEDSDSQSGHEQDVGAEHRAECEALRAERLELTQEFAQAEATRQELAADREGLRYTSEMVDEAASDAKTRAERLARELRTLEAELRDDDDIAPQPSGREAQKRGRLSAGPRMSQAGFGMVSLPDYLKLEREAEASSRRVDELKEEIQSCERRRGEQRQVAILRMRAREQVQEMEMEMQMEMQARAAEEDVGSVHSKSDAHAVVEQGLSPQSSHKDKRDGRFASAGGSDTSAHSFGEDQSSPTNSPGHGFANKRESYVSEPDGDIAAGDAAAGPGPSLKPLTPASVNSTERPGALSALMDGIRVRREFQHNAARPHSRADLHADVSVTRSLVDPGLGHEASTHSLPSSLHRGSSTSALAASSSGILWNLAAGPPGSGEFAAGPSARASWGGTVSSRLVGENLLLREEAEALQEEMLGSEGTEASTPCVSELEVEPFTLSTSSAPQCAGPQLEAALKRSQARLQGQMQQQLEDSRALLSTLRRGISDAEQRLRRERHGRQECEERLRHLEGGGGPGLTSQPVLAAVCSSPASPSPPRQPKGLLLPFGATGASSEDSDEDDEYPFER